ncbi:hypothetical protein FBUS_06872, partial [Fasciolopsis buskii]
CKKYTDQPRHLVIFKIKPFIIPTCVTAYDGPQSYDLANPDDLSEVQVIKVCAMHEQGDTGQPIPTNNTFHPNMSSGLCSTNLANISRKPYSIQSFQDADEAAITRSSTLMSSLDQDALLLSASDEEVEPHENGDPANSSILCNSSRTAPAVPARLSLLGNSTVPVCAEGQQSVQTQPQTLPVSRVVDWTTDSMNYTASRPQSVHQSPVDRQLDVLDVSAGCENMYLAVVALTWPYKIT